MTHHKTGTRADWLNARVDLLKAEKDLTHLSDQVAEQRRALPWVKLDKPYAFDTDAGAATLADLFDGRSQMLVYHFMFGPDYTAGCPSCSAIADGYNGIATHLAQHDVNLVTVSRAPLTKLQEYKWRMGWTFPWVSSAPSDFNADFNVWFSEEQQVNGEVDYNYRREAKFTPPLASGSTGPGAKFAAMCGTDIATYRRDRPGLSAFVKDGGSVYHTYSSYARGLDSLWGMHQWLDRAPLGRNEQDGLWWKRHDEYKPRKVA